MLGTRENRVILILDEVLRRPRVGRYAAIGAPPPQNARPESWAKPEGTTALMSSDFPYNDPLTDCPREPRSSSYDVPKFCKSYELRKDEICFLYRADAKKRGRSTVLTQREGHAGPMQQDVVATQEDEAPTRSREVQQEEQGGDDSQGCADFIKPLSARKRVLIDRNPVS